MKVSEVYSGKPSDLESRAQVERRARELLETLGIDCVSVDHPHADTIADCMDAEAVLGAHICKNLFLTTRLSGPLLFLCLCPDLFLTNRQQTEFYLLLMPGDKPFKTKLLSKQLGTARLSFASPQHMEELLGVTPGSVSILCLMNDTGGKVKAVIDSDVLKDEFLGCHPCMNTSSLKIRTADITDKFLPAVHHGFTAVELPWSVEE